MKTILLLVLCCQFPYAGVTQASAVDTSNFTSVQYRLFNSMLEEETELSEAYQNRNFFKGEEYYEYLRNRFLSRIQQYYITNTFPEGVLHEFAKRLAQQHLEYEQTILILYGKEAKSVASKFNQLHNNLELKFIGISYCGIPISGECLGDELRLPDYISKLGKGRYQGKKGNFNYIFDAQIYEYFNELILAGLEEKYGAKMVQNELSNYHSLVPKVESR